METGEKGIYRAADIRSVADKRLVLWMIKAILAAREAQPPSLSRVIRGPHLYPFAVTLPAVREVEDNRAFEITRHGLDHETFVSVRLMAAG